MAQISLIYDGDMGGDDLWALALLLAHRDKINILGMATCYGNVSQPFATQNLLNYLCWLRQEGFEIVQGADIPCDGMRPFGDDAYGSDGVGGVVFPRSAHQAVKTDIADWYAAKLDDAPEPVTILCTGPATNIALFIEKHPEKAGKITEFVFMGGAMNPPGKDGKPVFDENGTQRIGNITMHAEFNAFQDPKALNIILGSGVKTTIVSADATQHMVYTPERQDRIKTLDQTYGPAYHSMLTVVEPLDRAKFGVNGSFIHDPVAAAYLIAPALFHARDVSGLHFDEASPYPMHSTVRGKATISPTHSTSARWLDGVRDTEDVFKLIEDGIRVAAAQAEENREHLAK